MKLARNMLTFTGFAAATEALRLAEASGLDLQKLGRVVRHSDAQSGGPGAIMVRDDTKPPSRTTFCSTCSCIPGARREGPRSGPRHWAKAVGDVDCRWPRSLRRDLAAGLGVPHTGVDHHESKE